MSAAKQLTPEANIHIEVRVHLRAVFTDALRALDAVDRLDFSTADSALKSAMLAAADGRAALQSTLIPNPKSLVDEALKEWQ